MSLRVGIFPETLTHISKSMTQNDMINFTLLVINVQIIYFDLLLLPKRILYLPAGEK